MAGKPDARDIAASRERHYFSKATEARAKLSAKIDRYIDLHETAAKNAAERGNSAPIEWLLSHAEVLNDDGTLSRPIAAGIDRPQLEAKGNQGPTINIGFLGSVPPQVTVTQSQPVAIEGEMSADASTPGELLEPGKLGSHSGES